jgi:hypothetical protein
MIFLPRWQRQTKKSPKIGSRFRGNSEIRENSDVPILGYAVAKQLKLTTMHQFLAPPRGSAVLSLYPFSRGCITTMSEFEFAVGTPGPSMSYR